MVVRKALVIDDNRARREFIVEQLQKQQINCIALESEQWREDHPDRDAAQAVVMGSSEDCARLQKSLTESFAGRPIHLLEGDATTPPKRRHTDAGVFAEFDEKISKVVTQARRQSTGRSPRRSPELFRCLVGTSRSLGAVKQAITQVAGSDATVLLLGKSGTGKEVVARNIHYHSSRRGKPFVPVNCGAIPADLLESELFGHEKGSFTGAISSRRGRFEMAEGGTLFLDEIGDMPMPMQVKLLRVLQERTFERVGSEKTRHADVRIVAATHRDLEQLIATGAFREDLYFRLCVFPITVPPLSERIEDLPALIEDILCRLNQERNSKITLTSSALAALGQYAWPGNVRELANLVERLVIMYPNQTVDVADLPDKYRQHWQGEMTSAHDPARVEPEATPGQPWRLPPEGVDLKEHLAQVERALIEQALERADGVVARAAEILHTRRTTLVEKIRKYRINCESTRQDIDELSVVNY